MRNLKRFLAMTLTMLMIVSCFSMFSVNAFDDVYDFEEAIDTLAGLNVIKGYDDTTFGPDDDVTRWQMALLISKLTTGLTDTSVWYSESNTTKFADVVADNYFGSINFASGNGIIKGTSDTTFAPEAGIMFQDALTMVVRALGYGSEEMDKGYPWMFIEKADDLGLMNGLEYIDDTEATLTRAETAQLLYNALYAVNADDETIATAVFDLYDPEAVVVVLTATNRYNMNAAEGVLKKDYVAFNLVNAKTGIIDTGLTYYVDKAEFGIEGDADLCIGNTYEVTSFDGFATLESATLIDAGKTDAVIEGNANANTTLITIDGVVYEVVESYTSLNATGEYMGNYPEIVLYNKDGSYVIDGTGAYQTDAYGNLLDKNGQIALYYMPWLTSYANPYVVMRDDGTVIAANPDLTQYDLAKIDDGVVGGFSKITNTKTEIADINGVYDAKVFDVNGDGYYDYGYTVNYKYGAYGVNAVSGSLIVGTTDTGRKPDQIKYVDAEGNTIAAIGAGYYLYSYNAQAGVLTIKEQLSVYSGYLSGLNTIADQLTLGGTVYSYGFAKLPGAEAANVEADITAALIGKNINYVMYDGVIVDILPVQGNGYFVLDSVIGVTSSGLPTVLGYNQNNIATVVVVATLNTYTGYIYNFETDKLNGVPALFQNAEKGTLYTAQVDTLGYYHLTEADAALLVATAGETVNFKNGISNTGSVLGTFSTNDNTVILAYDPSTGKFESRKGQPATGATLVVPQGAEYVVVGAAPASFIYIKGAVSFEGYSVVDPWATPANTTLVYIDPANSKATIVDNSLSSVIGVEGMLLQGYTYKYSAVADLVNGKATDVYSVSYNAQVKAGYVYSVVNGYIDEEIGTLEDVLTAVTLANVTATAGTVDGVAIDRDNFVVMTVDANGNVVRAENSKGIANAVAAPAAPYSGAAYKVNATILAELGITAGNVYLVK